MRDLSQDQIPLDVKDRAAREWFGFGRWEAPYWFVGMEPGGDDCPEIYRSWYCLGATSLLDAKEHEQDYNRRVSIEQQTRYFATRPKIQQWTWQPLIHIVLGFTASNANSHVYQRDRFGSQSGEMAVLELSAIAAKTFVFADQATYQAGRIESLRNRLATYKPQIAVFYGLGYRSEYEQIVGGAFDEAGLYQNGNTLCVLIMHPSRAKKTYKFWRELGAILKLRLEERR